MEPLSAADLAHRLKEAREAHSWTPADLARAAGVSEAVVVREIEAGVERERNPLTLARLARALDKPWDWFGAAPPPTVPAGPSRSLYAARLAKGWSIDDLAAASGVGRATIHKLEHGGSGQTRTWADLARALEVPVAALRGE